MHPHLGGFIQTGTGAQRPGNGRWGDAAGFNVTRKYHNDVDTTVTLEWVSPGLDAGPASNVDNYSISIYPTPLSHPLMNLVSSPPWNVTLAHNISYTVNITAINIAGESEPTTLLSILIG